jgi:hypothetical protein
MTVLEKSKTKTALQIIGEGLLLCIPVLAVFALVYRYGVDVPFWDEWDNVAFYKDFTENGLRLSALFAFHNEHRVFFPRLLWLPLWELTDYNTKVLLFIQQVFPFAAMLAVYAVFRKDQPHAIWLFLPTAFYWFTFAQYENIMWFFQLAFYMVIAFPIFSFVFMHLYLTGINTQTVSVTKDTDGRAILQIKDAWAVDFKAGKLPRAIRIAVDGKLYLPQATGYPSPEPAETYNNTLYENSGILRMIRTPFSLQDGETHTVALFIQGESGVYISDTAVTIRYDGEDFVLTEVPTP